jgi:hypothetical protein
LALKTKQKKYAKKKPKKDLKITDFIAAADSERG